MDVPPSIMIAAGLGLVNSDGIAAWRSASSAPNSGHKVTWLCQVASVAVFKLATHKSVCQPEPVDDVLQDKVFDGKYEGIEAVCVSRSTTDSDQGDN